MASATSEPVAANNTSKVRADRLFLVCLSTEPCNDWLDAARKAGQPWCKDIVDNLSEVPLLLEEHSHAHFMVCYDAPEQQISNCLAKERLPSQALANWVNFTRQLLDIYRPNYQRMTLVRREMLESHPKELFAHLSSRSEISLGLVEVKKTEKQGGADFSEEQQRFMRELLALQSLQHSSARHLAQELNISSLPFYDSSSLLDSLDKICEVVRSSIVKKPEVLVEEYERILKIKEELITENIELKKKSEKQKMLQKEKEILESNLIDCQQENSLVMGQLQKTQEELEAYFLGSKGNKGDLEKLQREIIKKNEKLHSFSQKNKRLVEQLREARQQLKAVKNSKSWKVTAPFRKTFKVMGSKK